jgi:hypothetical protein
MKHVMRWLGRLEKNYRNLRPNPVQFVTIKGIWANVPAFPVDMDGIRFYCMEDMSSGKSIHLAVMVEDVKLHGTVLIDYNKHIEGKKIGPGGCSFGDNSAKNLLIDIADKNDDQREMISQIFEKYFGRSLIDNKENEQNYVSHDHSYVPIREDFENTSRKCLREGKERISDDDILDIMGNDLEMTGYRLAENWRLITKNNILIWSNKRKDQK